MQQHGSEYFACRPRRSKGQNSTFSEHGHVGYQIKLNHERSKIVANILPTDPSPARTFGWGKKVKIQNFQNQLHTSRPPPPDTWVEPKGINSIFSEHGYVAYKIKGYHGCKNIMIANILLADPTP